MPSPATTERYQHHRFPAALMSHGVWLNSRFPLRSRDGHELLCERGLAVSHDALRPWGRQCGQNDAPPLRHRRPRPGDPGHLEAGLWPMPGPRHDLGRAGAQADNVLARLGQRRRHQPAAQKGLRTLLQGLLDVPREIIPDKRKSSGAAKRARLPGVEPHQSRSLPHRCEHAHRPTRQHARRMQGVKSAGQAQRFLAAYGPIAPLSPPTVPVGGIGLPAREEATMRELGRNHRHGVGC